MFRCNLKKCLSALENFTVMKKFRNLMDWRTKLFFSRNVFNKPKLYLKNVVCYFFLKKLNSKQKPYKVYNLNYLRYFFYFSGKHGKSKEHPENLYINSQTNRKKLHCQWSWVKLCKMISVSMKDNFKYYTLCQEIFCKKLSVDLNFFFVFHKKLKIVEKRNKIINLRKNHLIAEVWLLIK